MSVEPILTVVPAGYVVLPLLQPLNVNPTRVIPKPDGILKVAPSATGL